MGTLFRNSITYSKSASSLRYLDNPFHVIRRFELYIDAFFSIDAESQNLNCGVWEFLKFKLHELSNSILYFL